MSSSLLRYALIGLVGTMAQYVLLIVLKESGVPVLPASALGYCAGGIINYYLNFKITFETRSTHGQAAPRFLVVALLGLVLNSVIVWLMVENSSIHYLVTQIVATLCCFAFTYALNSVWSFRKVEEVPD